MNGSVAEDARPAKAVVIGFGNDLRSDDGVGRWVADQIEALGLDDVDVRSVSQLTPELALTLAGRSMAVFVDASVDTPVLTVERVEPAGPAPALVTHHGSASALLSLTSSVGRPPETAIMISIPASNLEVGFEFSEVTGVAAVEAVEQIVELVTSFDA